MNKRDTTNIAEEVPIRLTYDWHTHTTYSHGKGTIEDNVKAGLKRRLSSIAITDHGPGHRFYGFRSRDIRRMRQEIDVLQPQYPGIKIYLSAEANILNLSGALDLSKEEIEQFDFIIAGYHFGTIGESPFQDIKLHRQNLIGNKRKMYSQKLKLMNTELVVRALYENPIKVLTHPGDKGAVFIDEVAKACEKMGTLLEISNHHIQLSAEAIKETSKYDVSYIIGSDAHMPHKVGDCDVAWKRIQEAGLDLKRIVNIEEV